MEGGVLLSVDGQGVAAQVDHPLDGGVLVLHSGVHEGSVASHGITHILERSRSQVRITALLQTLESLVTASPVSSLRQDQNLEQHRMMITVQETLSSKDHSIELSTSASAKSRHIKYPDGTSSITRATAKPVVKF